MINHRRVVLSPLLAFLVFSPSTRAAESVAACEGALVKATYNRFSSEHLDWRLASYVNEKTYDEIKHDAGANTVIYGVPVGANYGDFKRRVEEKTNILKTSLTHDQAINVMWTGLDPNAPSGYATCLQTLVLSSFGLHSVVKSATTRDIAILLRWVPRGNDPRVLTLTWSGISTDEQGKALPRTLTAGEQVIIVARPKTQRQLAVNAAGFGDVITLEPMPPPPPQLKQFTYGLQAAGFAHRRAADKQIPGTACGEDGMGIYANGSGANTPTTVMNGKAGVPVVFRWDAGWICRGQGIQGYPQNLGTIDFGEGTRATVPEIFGIATATYPYPGSYAVTVTVNATCVDVGHPPNRCSRNATLQINIAP